MKKGLLCVFLFVIIVYPVLSETEMQAPQKEEKSAILPIILNWLPGFGMGSFIEGDVLCGLLLVVGDCVGRGDLCIAEMLLLGQIISFGSLDLPWETINQYFTTGLIIYGCSKLFGTIRPIWFAAEYNSKLKQNQISFDVVPAIEPEGDGRRVAIGFQFRLKFNL